MAVSWLIDSNEVLNKPNLNLSLLEQSRSTSDSGSYIVYQRDGNEYQNCNIVDMNLTDFSINNLLPEKYWKCSHKWNSELRNETSKHATIKPLSDEVKATSEKPSPKNIEEVKETVKQKRKV